MAQIKSNETPGSFIQQDSQVVDLREFIRNGNDTKSAVALGNIQKISGRWLLGSDFGALILAFLLGGLIAGLVNLYILRDGFQPFVSFDSLAQFAIFLGLGSVGLLWLDTRGHYRQRLPFWETAGHILAVSIIGFLVCGFIQFATKSTFSRLWLASSCASFGILLLIGRSMVRHWLTHIGKWEIPTLLVGSGPSAQAAIRALKSEPSMGFTIVRQISPETLQHLTKPNAWKRLMAMSGASHLFLALESGELETQNPALQSLMRERVPCSIVPPWLGLPSSTLSLHHFMLHDVLLLHDTNRLRLPLPRLIKRCFDMVLASAILVALAPLFAIVAIIVRRDGGPAFFMQQRIGRNGKPFSCYKFRSMRIDAEEYLEQYLADNPEAAAEWQKFQKLKNDVRITRFGNFIRRTSIDELPQLINVVKGHMSLVGPRPIMPGQESYYADDFIYYESVRPGITGPWQVSGRNKLTFKERVALEASYTRNWSLWMDIVIMLKTIPAVLSKDEAF